MSKNHSRVCKQANRVDAPITESTKLVCDACAVYMPTDSPAP